MNCQKEMGSIMIKGCCITNVDKFKQEKWPEIFSEVPRVGDRVACEVGKELTVVSVTHTQKIGIDYFEEKGLREPFNTVEPYIVVELNNERA